MKIIYILTISLLTILYYSLSLAKQNLNLFNESDIIDCKKLSQDQEELLLNTKNIVKRGINPSLIIADDEKQYLEYELILENVDSYTQLFLYVSTDKKFKNDLRIELRSKTYPLSEWGSILKIELDKEIITCNDLTIKNTTKIYLEPSTLSHKKSYSIYLIAFLTDDDLLKFINSIKKKVRISSQEFNEEWTIINNNLDKIRPFLVTAPLPKIEAVEEDLSVVELNAADQNNYGVEKGVMLKIINSNGKFFNSELEEGSVIMQINGMDIEDTSHFNKLMKEIKSGSSIFTIKTISGEMKFIVINIP